ncbi:MAG: hypothetical protein CMJ58_04160 [Planctomycetaceae bacterium]|nr:hypothetical protein [Planctomycetaceae bacterium]
MNPSRCEFQSDAVNREARRQRLSLWRCLGPIAAALAGLAALRPAPAAAQILGANYNETSRYVDEAQLALSKTKWVRGFFDILQMQDVGNLATNDNIVGLRRAQAAGQQVIFSFKWAFENHNQNVPTPGSPQEAALFARAVETLEAVGAPINHIVLGNEPMWETRQADLQRPAPGEAPAVVTFTERLLDYVQQHYGALQTQRPQYYVGSLNRLYDAGPQGSAVVQEFFQLARDNPLVAGVDLHVHYDTLQEAQEMMQFARSTLGAGKDLLATEFSPVWRYQNALDEPIGADPAGAQFAQQYGYEPSLLVQDYLHDAFASQVSRQEWTDFIVSQPWFNEHHIRNMHALFRQHGVSVATLGYNQTEAMRGLDPTRSGYAPFQINWLFIEGLVEESEPLDASNEPYMADWLDAQHLLADVDRDSDIDLSDWQLMLPNLMRDLAAEQIPPEQWLAAGDLNKSGQVDRTDFRIFKDAYVSRYGPAAFDAQFAVPEPTSLALVPPAAATAWLLQRMLANERAARPSR